MHLVSSKIEFEIKSIFRFKLLDKLLFDLGLWTKVEDDKRTIRQALKRFFWKIVPKEGSVQISLSENAEPKLGNYPRTK